VSGRQKCDSQLDSLFFAAKARKVRTFSNCGSVKGGLAQRNPPFRFVQRSYVSAHLRAPQDEVNAMWGWNYKPKTEMISPISSRSGKLVGRLITAQRTPRDVDLALFAGIRFGLA
jgi:hypothetical protein